MMVGKKRVTPVENISRIDFAIRSCEAAGIVVIDAGESVHLEVDESGREELVDLGRPDQFVDGLNHRSKSTSTTADERLESPTQQALAQTYSRVLVFFTT